MRRSVFAVLILAVVAGVGDVAAQARPDIRVGPQLSFADDADLGIGGRVEIGLPTIPVSIIGMFDYFFPGNDVDYWELNANGTYGFPLNTTDAVIPYVGGGLNIAHVSAGPFDDTEVGLNLLGGGRFPVSQVDLFFELRFEISGGEQVVVSGGVLF